MRFVLPVLLLFMSCKLHAADDFSFQIGARLQSGSWNGKSSNGDYRQTAGRLGTSFSVQSGRFFGGINLIRGDFQFSDRSPDRPTGTAPSLPTTVIRNDVDLVFGYRFNPYFAGTFGLKSIVNEWQADGYRIEGSGLAVGISANRPTNTPVFLFGNFSLFAGPSHVNDVKFGSAGGASLEFGTGFQHKKTSLYASILIQTLRYDFDNNDIMELSLSGLILGVQHGF